MQRENIGLIDSSFLPRTTEQPHKHPLVAALIGFLVLSPQKRDERDHAPEADGEAAKEQAGAEGDDFNIGTTLVRDLIVSFRSDLDARLWRKVRLTVSVTDSSNNQGEMLTPWPSPAAQPLR